MLAGCAADPSSDPATSTTESELSSNTHTAFNYFVSKGLTKRQSAGIVGNLLQESGMDPTIKQFGGGPGRGIAQWSVGGRWDTSHHDNVAWYAAQHGWSRWSLRTQLHFIWYELADIGYGFHALRATTTINGAVLVFMRDYEICGACDASRRETYAHEVYNAYATSAAPTSCYSPTFGTQIAHGSCVQSPDDNEIYVCDGGDWVPADYVDAPCFEVHTLQ